jgi:glycosyltransferase involved in cell wall biosynthesis
MARFLHLGLGFIGDRGGGLERYQHGICTQHALLGHDVNAWVQSRTPIPENLPYHCLAYASPDQSRSTKICSLRRLVSGKEPFKDKDLFFVSHHASVSGSLLNFLSGAPHTVHFQGPWAEEAAKEGAPRWKTFLQAREERKVYRQADRIITLSDAFRKIIIERYGAKEEKVQVIPGAIDAAAANPGLSRDQAREQLGWPKDRRIVLCVRRLVRRVGVDVLVAAVDQLFRNSPGRYGDLLVLIGGTGPLREELEQQINERKLEDYVQLLGFVPDEKLSTAYRAANTSIVPTQALEGFGLVMLESMAAGTPCLVTPVGSLPEVMNDLDPNLILSNPSASAIAQGLRDILHGDLQLPSDDACRHYVRQRYDWSVIAPRVLDAYVTAGR